MPRPRLAQLQLERLRRAVDYCRANVPLYARRLEEAGVQGDRIKTLSDLRHIPFTTKEDLRAHYPFGMLAVPRRQVVRIHASSGTTGKPTVACYTREDLDVWSDCVARFCAAVGVGEEDTAQISFGYGMFTGALGLHAGLEKLGCAVIPASAGNTDKQLMYFTDFKPTVLVSTPSYAMYLGEHARRAGIGREQLALRIGLLGSEGCTPALRDKIEAALGLFATDNYGISELIGPGVAGECALRAGHHIAEDHFLPEIIDPHTGEPLPVGERGELVITTLTKQGMPLLRYRTGDITRLDDSPCPCGRTHIRMEKVAGRSDDMLKIRGVKVFPSQIESVLLEIPGVAPFYELVLTRRDYTDRLTIRCEVEAPGLVHSAGLRAGLLQRLKSVLGISTEVELLPPDSLPRFQGKARHIVDRREECGE